MTTHLQSLPKVQLLFEVRKHNLFVTSAIIVQLKGINMMQVIVALSCILSAFAKEYHHAQTAADRLSWSYDDADKGDANGCSEGSKCGPSKWKDVSLEFILNNVSQFFDCPDCPKFKINQFLKNVHEQITAVSPTVNSCGGDVQSPINLNVLTIEPDSALKFPTFVEGDGCSNWTQFVDDHALEVDFSKTGNSCDKHKITVDDVEHTLAQFHFHSPSEHTVAGGFADGELHMVHTNVYTYICIHTNLCVYIHILSSYIYYPYCFILNIIK
jgi:carbonic anhydrase